MTPEEKKEKKKPLSKSDQDMIDELDYEYKKAHKLFYELFTNYLILFFYNFQKLILENNA